MRGSIGYAFFMVAAAFLSMAIALGLVFLAAMGWPHSDWPFLLGPFVMVFIFYWLDYLGRSLFGESLL